MRKAGCANCYTVFRDDLIKMTRQYQQGHDHHVGSIPNLLRTPDERIEERLVKLAGELERAVEQEDYERAARIKKEMIQLKGQGEA
ncbi:UvrB/UvrC motif-containing protein [Exiguobacterium sp.]|uniref:UvrB/UvrC motif-containing protein n=2 Tax=Exiguobacterium sp. TaxID=44751 RepID=UPI00263A6B1A|nr:UvrB/UvrC motif-containing protein [Exiguobacterium sp.]